MVITEQGPVLAKKLGSLNSLYEPFLLQLEKNRK